MYAKITKKYAFLKKKFFSSAASRKKKYFSRNFAKKKKFQPQLREKKKISSKGNLHPPHKNLMVHP